MDSVYVVEYYDSFEGSACSIIASVVSSLNKVKDVIMDWNVDQGEFWVFEYKVDDLTGDCGSAIAKYNFEGELI